jgi:hypothetical protein
MSRTGAQTPSSDGGDRVFPRWEISLDRPLQRLCAGAIRKFREGRGSLPLGWQFFYLPSKEFRPSGPGFFGPSVSPKYSSKRIMTRSFAHAPSGFIHKPYRQRATDRITGAKPNFKIQNIPELRSYPPRRRILDGKKDWWGKFWKSSTSWRARGISSTGRRSNWIPRKVHSRRPSSSTLFFREPAYFRGAQLLREFRRPRLGHDHP